MPTKDFNPDDYTFYFNGLPLGKMASDDEIEIQHYLGIPPSVRIVKVSQRSDWHADYLEEQKPPVKELEPEIGFTRISWFEDGRFKVKRVPIVHG
jgi:hypothetical protein